MEGEQGAGFLESVARYQKLGWICLGIGIVCRAIGYGQATPGSFPFGSGSDSFLGRLWLPMTLLEAGMVLLILGTILMALSAFFELLYRNRKC